MKYEHVVSYALQILRCSTQHVQKKNSSTCILNIFKISLCIINEQFLFLQNTAVFSPSWTSQIYKNSKAIFSVLITLRHLVPSRGSHTTAYEIYARVTHGKYGHTLMCV